MPWLHVRAWFCLMILVSYCLTRLRWENKKMPRSSRHFFMFLFNRRFFLSTQESPANQTSLRRYSGQSNMALRHGRPAQSSADGYAEWVGSPAPAFYAAAVGSSRQLDHGRPDERCVVAPARSYAHAPSVQTGWLQN